MNVVQASAPGSVNSPERSAGDVLSILSAATRLLFTNGETTRRMILGLERLGRALGVNVTVSARWGEVVLRIDDPAGPRLHWIAATPVGVDMQKVAAANDLIDRICKNAIGFDDAQKELAAIRHLPPVSLARFVLLTAAGAAALGVILGAGQWVTLGLIALSAGAGALLRRWLATLGQNPFAQPFGAALLAGLIGAIVARLQLVSMPHLVAVCPCMVLVPGPHFLNGGIDLINGRIALGVARSVYAGLIVVSICVGLLLGLAFLGVSLPTDPSGRVIPLW